MWTSEARVRFYSDHMIMILMELQKGHWQMLCARDNILCSQETMWWARENTAAREEEEKSIYFP